MRYATIKNNQVENIILVEPSFVETIQSSYQAIVPVTKETKVGIGWAWTEQDGIIEPEYEESASAQSFKITKLAFKSRFPNAKWRAGKALASVSEDVADFFEDFDLATHIDLTLQKTINGIAFFSSGLVPEAARLTEQEASDVLNTPATDEEVWRG